MNFIALGVIAEIDNLYASSLKKFKCKAVLEEENIPLETKGGLKDFKVTIWVRIQRIQYRLLKILFVSFYFYFSAFSTIVFS